MIDSIVADAGNPSQGTQMETAKKDSLRKTIWLYVMAALRGLAFGHFHIRVLVHQLEEEETEEEDSHD